ncbi:hypothetical protein ACK3SF_03480 [Candidatus Nanosalina sp. VS9-1]|uniref:hypothetical protein n=1 Tax=Candidatus Nanosalina sp. VS9-1 TaxID=3388566 RepID=UPI0039E04018
MSENYYSQFKAVLSERLEVPDGRDREEALGLLLSNNSDIDEVENICEACTIHLSDDGRTLLQQYSQAIDENLEWAKKLDSTHTSPNKKNEYSMLFSLSDQLVSELEKAVGEGKELENIARRLKDAHLLAEVDYEGEQMQEMGNRLSGLMERQEKLETLLSEYENLESYAESHRIVESLKHRKNVIGVVLENAGEASERKSGNTKIFIDKEFLQNLRHAANTYNEEITGLLICRKEGKDWTVLKTLKTGVGDEQSVSPDEARLRAANQLIENYAKYRLVEFHTHSVGTIHRYGPKYAESWSEGDIENFKEQGEGYIGMLVTPKKVLLKGNSRDPELNTFDRKSSGEFSEWREELDEEWSNIASGYSFEKLPEPTEFSGGG